MSSRNIFIITLILGFLPNLIFAATINSIVPDRGKAGEIVVINGENFGDDKKSVNKGYRYVRVGGFINTKILSWSDSAVEIGAPTLQEATSDITRLNPFWLAADIVSLKLLSLAVKLFDTTVSPVSTDVDNAVAIAVVTPPLKESNQGFFTYTARPPLMGVVGDFNNLLSVTYDTYGEDIVGLLTNPKELFKTKIRETVRGLQETPLFVRDLFINQDPSRPLSTDKDTSNQNTMSEQQTTNQTATQNDNAPVAQTQNNTTQSQTTPTPAPQQDTKCVLSGNKKQIEIGLKANEWSCLVVTPEGSRYQIDPENKNTELSFKFSDGSTFVDGPGDDPFWLGEKRGVFQLMSKLPMKVSVAIELPPLSINLVGVWHMTWRDKSWRQGSSEIKMKQKLGENKFTGTGTQVFEGQTQTFTIEGEVTKADIVGRNVSFTGNFGNDTVTYQGTAIDDRADGTWKHSSGNSGTWSMTRRVDN